MAYGFNNDKSKVELLDFFYPVGSIYQTSDNTFDPNVVWGGTWEKVQGRFLLGSSNKYSIGTTGGSADAVVVSHRHSFSLGSLSFFTVGGTVSTFKVGGTPAVSNSTQTEGESGTGKNMPPYLVVNIWKRVL